MRIGFAIVCVFVKGMRLSMIETSINVNKPLQSAAAERHYATVSRSKDKTARNRPSFFHSPNPFSNYPLSSDGRERRAPPQVPPSLKYTLPSEAAWGLRGPPVTGYPRVRSSASAAPLLSMLLH